MKNEDTPFIPFEIALELKEMGFDEPCYGFHRDGELFHSSWNYLTSQARVNYMFGDRSDVILAIIYGDAFKWFRNKYNLHHNIVTYGDFDKLEYQYHITEKNISGSHNMSTYLKYKTYREAELACLIKLIDIVKTK
jgi:hypothetical protein